MSRNGAFRCGYAAIVGRPNVGKSTLLNHLLRQKLSITSRKPQTTRHRVLGINTADEYQAIYLDTPGLLHGRQRAINRYMNRVAVGALAGVDVVIFVVEALAWTQGDAHVTEQFASDGPPVILAVNKVDRVRQRTRLLPFIEQVGQAGDFAEIVPLSALRRENVDRLEQLVVNRLPERDAIFPSDQLTDRSVRFLAAEIVREKLTRRLGQELPYRLGVEIERFSEGQDVTEIAAVVWVEKPGQKAIVIGNKGSVLKAVGTDARHDLEAILGGKVFLRLWVKVKAGWSDSEQALRRMGYGGDGN